MSFLNFNLDKTGRNLESKIAVEQGNGHGSTNTAIRRFVTLSINRGSDITYLDSAANGASFTINKNGLYKITYTDFSTARQNFGVSSNSTELTTDIALINVDNMEVNSRLESGTPNSVNTTIFLVVGDVIRPHTDGGLNSSAANNQNVFVIQKVL